MAKKDKNSVSITLKVTPDQVKEAVKQYLKLPPDTHVWFNVQKEYTGYGINETATYNFKGAEATFNKPLEEVL